MSCTKTCHWVVLVICLELFICQVVNSNSTCGQLSSTDTRVQWSCTISPSILRCRYRYKKGDEGYKDVSSGRVKYRTDDGVRVCAMEVPIVDLSPGSYTFEVVIHFNPHADNHSRNLLIINGATGTASDCTDQHAITVISTLVVYTLLAFAAFFIIFYVRKRNKRSLSSRANASLALTPTPTNPSPPGSPRAQPAPSTESPPLVVSRRPVPSPNRGRQPANPNVYHHHIPPRLATAAPRSLDPLTPDLTSPEIILIPVGINRKKSSSSSSDNNNNNRNSNANINNINSDNRSSNSNNNTNDCKRISDQVNMTKNTGQAQTPINRATPNQNLVAKPASDCQDSEPESEIEDASELHDVETPSEHEYENIEPTSGREDAKPTSIRERVKPLSGREAFKPTSECKDVETPIQHEDVKPPSECEDVETPIQHEDVKPPSECEDVETPIQHEDVKPPSECEDVETPIQHEDVKPPSECEDVETPIQHEDVKPPSECEDAGPLSRREHAKPTSKRQDNQSPSLTLTPLARAHVTNTGATDYFKPSDDPKEIPPIPRRRSKKDDYMDFDPCLDTPTPTSISSSSPSPTVKNKSIGNYHNVKFETQTMDQSDEGVVDIEIPRRENSTEKISFYEEAGPLFLHNRVRKENGRDVSSDAAKRSTTLPQYSDYMNVVFPEDCAGNRSSV